MRKKAATWKKVDSSRDQMLYESQLSSTPVSRPEYEENEDGTRQVPRKTKVPPKLSDIVEPDLADKLKLTERDDEIRNEDIPERIAISLSEKEGLVKRDKLSEEELESEATWLYQELYKEGVSKAVELEQEPMENDMPEYPDEEKYSHLRKLIRNKLRIVEDDLLLFIPKGARDEERSRRREKALISNIKKFLSLHVNEAYEIPYIGMYCRDAICHLLDADLGDEKLGMLEYEIERESAVVEQVLEIVHKVYVRISLKNMSSQLRIYCRMRHRY